MINVPMTHSCICEWYTGAHGHGYVSGAHSGKFYRRASEMFTGIGRFYRANNRRNTCRISGLAFGPCGALSDVPC